MVCCNTFHKTNRSLDKDILNKLFKEPRGNKYFYGEIFVTSDKIGPDSSRQGLAAGEAADALISQLRKYFKDVLYQLYTKANKYKGHIKNIRDYVEKIETSEQSVKPILAEQLENSVEKFQKATVPTASVEINDIIDIFKQEYEKDLSRRVTDILVNYGKHKPAKADPQPAVVPKPQPTEVSEPQPAAGPEPQPTAGPEQQSKSKAVPTPVPGPTQPSTSSQQPSHAPKQPKQQKKAADVFSELILAGYTDKEVELLRKAYKYMGYVCTCQEKKKFDSYLEWAIKSIVKEDTH